MENYQLRNFSKRDLNKFARDLGISTDQTKESVIHDIIEKIDNFREENKPKHLRFTKKVRLGERSSEGTTYLVENGYGTEFAMKTFRRNKSTNSLYREAKIQQLAANKNLAPNIYYVDAEMKYIVMDKLDTHLIDVIKFNGNRLTINNQKKIIQLFKNLDKCKVFHGDANISNYMIKDGEIYAIDFGMSQEIDDNVIKKYGTDEPNLVFMTIIFIIKLKEMGCSSNSYKYLQKYLSDEDAKLYEL